MSSRPERRRSGPIQLAYGRRTGGHRGRPIRSSFERGGRLFARGACDAKGPIAGMMEAIHMLCAMRDRWSGTVLAVFVVDEEVASQGARFRPSGRRSICASLVNRPQTRLSLRTGQHAPACARKRHSGAFSFTR